MHHPWEGSIKQTKHRECIDLYYNRKKLFGFDVESR